MFNANLKKQALIMGAATLALAASANSLAGLVPNGDFENGGANWAVEPAGGASFSFEAAGGNGGGYLKMDNTSAVWGGVAISTDADPADALSVFGAVAGDSTTFLWDMKSNVAATQGGIKLEYYDIAGGLTTSGDHFFASTTDWASYSFTETISATAVSMKVVLLGIDATSIYGFDNVCVNDCSTSAVPVPAAVWLFGSGLLGLVGVARRKKA